MKHWRLLISVAALCSPFLAHAADVTDACAGAGRFASQVAQWRDDGIPESRVAADVLPKAPTDEARAYLTKVIHQLYTADFSKNLSPDAAAPIYAADCATQENTAFAGSKTYTTDFQIRSGLAGFKTFTGKPLVTLLKRYRVSIKNAEMAPIAGLDKMDGAQPGDIYWTINVSASRPKKMPCDLQDWVKPASGTAPAPEFLQRAGLFPVIRPDADDPLIYWAATGKCSARH